jgi:hypothetical protein
MKTLNRQQGLSGIGWLFVLALIAGGVLVTLKLLPVYLQNMTIASVLEEVRESGDTYSSATSVRMAIGRRFEMNNVDQLNVNDILISRQGRVYDVTTNYEVRVPFVYNIDFILTFDDRAEVPAG